MKLTLTQLSEELEEYIDRYSLQLLIALIAEICRAKAEHISSAWQCDSLAITWEQKAEKLETIELEQV